MRLVLNERGHEALKRIQARCKEINPHIEPTMSAFLSDLLRAIDTTVSKAELKAIAERLTSDRIKRKLIREEILRIADQADESDVQKFVEKIAKKQAFQKSDFGEKQPKIAENSEQT